MKKRLMACIVACAILLMGTGYAYWTDLIEIKTTAGTGKFDVQFTAAEPTGNNFAQVEGSELVNETSYDKVTRTADVNVTDKDVVDIELTKMYPGHYEAFTATAKNFGDVAAKLGKITTGVSGDATLKSMLGVAISAKAYYDTEEWVDTSYYKDVFKTCSISCHKHDHTVKHAIGCDHSWWACLLFGCEYGYWTKELVVQGEWVKDDNDMPVVLDRLGPDYFSIGSTVFRRLNTLNDISVDEQLSNYLYLSNDSRMEFNIVIGMDPDAAGVYTTGSSAKYPMGASSIAKDFNSYDKSASVTLGLVWDQYNER